MRTLGALLLDTPALGQGCGEGPRLPSTARWRSGLWRRPMAPRQGGGGVSLSNLLVSGCHVHCGRGMGKGASAPWRPFPGAKAAWVPSWLLRGDREVQVDRRGWLRGSPTSSLLQLALRKKLLLFSSLRTPGRVLLVSMSLLSAHPPLCNALGHFYYTTSSHHPTGSSAFCHV